MLLDKSREFWGVIKTGRTHLQDATPIRLGQEYLGYAGQMEHGLKRLRHVQEELSWVALGGTAVGTGVNAHPQFAPRTCARLSELAGVLVRETDNHFQAQSTLDAVVHTSGALRTLPGGWLREIADEFSSRPLRDLRRLPGKPLQPRDA